ISMVAQIKEVVKGSIAEEIGIEAGDEILSIDGFEIKDIIDYQFYSHDNCIQIELRKADQELWSLEIEKDYDEEMGIVFDDLIFDKMKVCKNRCIFCFVDQLPVKMRKTLYVKDDDYRYSFLLGNFITLTNLQEQDWQKICSMRLSPLYISVHCTQPELRAEILNNPKACTIKDDLARLKNAGIEIHTQIVLCPGINDGIILEESIEDLAKYFPSVLSVGIVPVGLTGHRQKLSELRAFTPEEASNIIRQGEEYQQRFRPLFRRGFVYLADEFYIKAGEQLPDAEYYDDYCQIENGIGLARIFWDEFSSLEAALPRQTEPREVNLLTGLSAVKILEKIVARLNLIEGLTVNLLAVANNFFGGDVSVTGLLTGSDIIAALGKKYNGKIVIIPEVVLKEGHEILLDNVSIKEIAEHSGAKIITVDGSASSLVDAVIDGGK
ncbi:MAG: DUF512 domain-containing protein, partial [Syntrophomonadaceae bacterium]|nr:DUF512 domain-containing protein [Syntrophomonadaceae bacterium]